MTSDTNVYEDAQRAEAYATLDFPGTYYLAYRDLPDVISANVTGTRALDFGCGAGRSTRFLRNLGFEVSGIDISGQMIEQARKIDPEGDYRLIEDGDFSELETGSFDLIQSIFAFDNIPGEERRAALLNGLRGLLKESGRIILLDSTPEAYWHEWASFSTKDFPQNRLAKSGETVYVVMKDVEDARPVVDQLWTDEDYLRLFETAGLKVVAKHYPMGQTDEPFEWVNETTVPVWVIYVLGRA